MTTAARGDLDSADQRIALTRPIVECSDAGADELAELYWRELTGFTKGLVRARRRGGETALRLAGIVTLLRFGPRRTTVEPGRVACRLPILGGVLAAQPGGELVIAQDDAELRLAVHGYAPSLVTSGPVGRLLYGQLQRRIHAAAADRFLERAALGRAR